jgi:hypothetical protein
LKIDPTQLCLKRKRKAPHLPVAIRYRTTQSPHVEDSWIKPLISTRHHFCDNQSISIARHPTPHVICSTGNSIICTRCCFPDLLDFREDLSEARANQGRHARNEQARRRQNDRYASARIFLLVSSCSNLQIVRVRCFIAWKMSAWWSTESCLDSEPKKIHDLILSNALTVFAFKNLPGDISSLEI